MFIHQRVSTNIYWFEHFDTGPRLRSLVYVQIRSYIHFCIRYDTFITNWYYLLRYGVMMKAVLLRSGWKVVTIDIKICWSVTRFQRLLYNLDFRFNCTVIVIEHCILCGLDKSPYKCIYPYNSLTRFHSKFQKLITAPLNNLKKNLCFNESSF